MFVTITAYWICFPLVIILSNISKTILFPFSIGEIYAGHP